MAERWLSDRQRIFKSTCISADSTPSRVNSLIDSLTHGRHSAQRLIFSRCQFGSHRKIRKGLATASLLLASLVSLATAQVNAGLPSFSAYDKHEIDTINLQNLNVVINSPVMSKSGAIPFNYSLWDQFYVTVLSGSFLPIAGGFGGGVDGYLGDAGNGYAAAQSQTTVLCPDGVHNTSVYSKWFIKFSDGTTHALPPSDETDLRTDGSGLSCYSESFTDQTIDSSGYTLSVSQNTAVSLYYRSGLDIQPTSLSITDANNNSISTTSSLSFTDTLGVSPVLHIAAGPKYEWTDVSGGSPTVTETEQSLALKSAFGCGHNSRL